MLRGKSAEEVVDRVARPVKAQLPWRVERKPHRSMRAGSNQVRRRKPREGWDVHRSHPASDAAARPRLSAGTIRNFTAASARPRTLLLNANSQSCARIVLVHSSFHGSGSPRKSTSSRPRAKASLSTKYVSSLNGEHAAYSGS